MGDDPSFVQGRKPVHTGINFWIPNAAYGLPLNETTLAEVLNKRGFQSHAVGKYVPSALVISVRLSCHSAHGLDTSDTSTMPGLVGRSRQACSMRCCLILEKTRVLTCHVVLLGGIWAVIGHLTCQPFEAFSHSWATMKAART